MGNYYWTRTDKDLRVLRSKKVNRLTKIRHEPMTYFGQQEARKLAGQIDDIDAVLAARAAQTEVF